jgi:hypothetical protein
VIAAAETAEETELAAQVAEHMFDEFCSVYGTLSLGGRKYALAGDEEAAELGYDDDPCRPVVLRRESDGAYFEVALSAHVVALPAPAARREAAAKLPENSGWVLWGPCGCPQGVTTARRGGQVCAATEDEAWRSLYDDPCRMLADRREGCRLELMTHEQYVAEVSPLMRGRCPHQPEPAGQQELPGESR